MQEAAVAAVHFSGIEFNGEGLGLVSSIPGGLNLRLPVRREGGMNTLVCLDVFGSEVLDKLDEIVNLVNGSILIDEEDLHREHGDFHWNL
jgi:hypothetical protein